MKQPSRPSAASSGGEFLAAPSLVSSLLLLLLVVSATRLAAAQPLLTNDSDVGTPDGKSVATDAKFNPWMTIIIIVAISGFFLIVFITIIFRQLSSPVDRFDPLAGGGSARRCGLDPDVLATFPALVYSDVKGLKIGKCALECAVCLAEFADDDSLRLLPRCSHVFHCDCIDAWLEHHVTCPVCRSDLSDTGSASPDAPDPAPPGAPAPGEVAIEVEEGEERREELAELARIASRRRGVPRSHSTGHSLALLHRAEREERFKLRLPEHVRREILSAGTAQRAQRAEGLRGGSVREGRMRSQRWPSFLTRNISVRVPSWAVGRREGSVRRADTAGEAPTRGKLATPSFDCLGGGGIAAAAKAAAAAEGGEDSAAAALARS